MDYFKKKQLVFWGIALLVVMNISALATVWYQQHRLPPPHEMPGPQPPDPRFLHRELGLSQQQVQQFAELQRSHFEQASRIQQAIRQLKEEQFQQLTAASSDAARADSIAGEIGHLQAQLERETFHHFLALKKLCTPDQQRKLNHLFGQMLRRMEPPHRHENGPHNPKRR